MAKKLEIQTNFTCGELSPRLYAHVDVNKYKDGLKVAQNVRVIPQGPIRKRNGTKYISETKTSSKISRLLKFQFSQTNAYILEFGYHYIRFYKDGGQILSAGIPYEVSTTYNEDELFALTYAQFGTTIYITHPAHPTAQLVWTSDAVWTLSDVNFFPPITDEEGFAPALTLTPAAVTGLGINFTASGAVFLAGDAGRQLVETDASGAIKSGGGRASITSVTSTTVVVADIIVDFPSTSAIASGLWKMDLSPIAQLVPNGGQLGSSILLRAVDPSNKGHVQPNTTLVPAAVTGSGVNFTSGAVAFNAAADVGKIIVNLIGPGRGTITSVTSTTVAVCTITEDWPSVGTWAATNWEVQKPIDTFRAADIDSYIVIQNGIAQITAVNSAWEVKADVQKSLSSIAGTKIWSLESPAWNATNGYPAVVAFDQQRLMLASWPSAPQTVVFSESGDFTNMGIGSNDSDAISIDISTNKVNSINWALNIRQDMVLGSAGAELSVNSGSGGPLTPSTIQQVTRSYFGSNIQQALPLGAEGLYYQRSGRKIMSIRYDFLVDTYQSEDLVFLAEHLTEGLIKEMAFAQDPDRNIYAVLEDGKMIVGTYYKEQSVIGWTKYTTDGSYESVQTVSTGQYDEVWVIVKRTINGSTKRYIERFDYSDGSSSIDGFSDAYLTLSNPLTVTGITNANPGVVTSASHGLSNGNTVKIFGSGMTDVDGIAYTVAGVTTNTFQLASKNTTSAGTFSGTGSCYVYKLVTTISGLSHLEGKTVQVKQDGAAANTAVVTSGAITLTSPAYQVTVGLPYTLIVHTLSKEYNLGIGSQQGQQTRYVRPILRLYKSVFPTLNGEYKPARDPTMLMDSKIPIFSGDVVYGSLSWDSTAELIITDSTPFPVQILGILGSLEGGSQ